MLTLLFIVVTIFVIAACIALIYGKESAQDFLKSLGQGCGGCASTVFWGVLIAIVVVVVLTKINGG